MMAAAKSNLKKVTLELGGKGATIVFNDADLKNAIFWSTVGITSHNGQICIAGSRIFVQDEIFDAFVAGFTQAAQGGEAGVGDPTKKETMKGPMISSAQRDKVLNYIKSGKDDGAKLLFGGEKHDRSGHYIQNTAFVDVSGESKIWKEEIFGPVAVSFASTSILLLYLLFHASAYISSQINTNLKIVHLPLHNRRRSH